MYVFRAHDRSYSNCTWEKDGVQTSDEMDLDPVGARLLDGDSADEDMRIYRTSRFWSSVIPGVLELGINAKTFGRKGKRLCYKCTPNDRTLPAVLIPCELKTTGFSKAGCNKYVLFRLEGPSSFSGKHLFGSLTQTIGEVDNYDAFCDHQMNCEGLTQSIQRFTKDIFMQVKKGVNRGAIDDKYNPLDRSHERTITIDPYGCKDFDDALHWHQEDGKDIVRIHIANVSVWMDVLDLWSKYPGRVSTVYFPERIVPMLPSTLSEGLCSLAADGTPKYTLCLTVEVSGDLAQYGVSIDKVRIERNYVYEEDNLVADTDYVGLYKVARTLNGQMPYLEKIEDSHDVVAFYMMLMNHRIALMLRDARKGLFRGMDGSDKQVSHLPQEVRCIARAWGTKGGEYMSVENLKRHAMLPEHVDVYCQSTSPIRRLVDLVNQALVCGLVIGNDSLDQPALKTVDPITQLNKKMGSVKKVQNSCNLLHSVMNRDAVFGELHGYVLECSEADPRRGEGYWCMIYVPELRSAGGALSPEPLELYSVASVSVHLFTDENTLKRKVRLNLL
jgi:hypothetical protein